MKKTVICLVVCFLLSGCISSASADKAFESKLDKAYEKLYSARFGLEYPPNQKILDLCIKHNDKSCLSVYTYVQSAKKFIHEAIENDDPIVLSNTLNKITVRCADGNNIKDFTCVGAVIALYFFDKEKHQQLIRDALAASGNHVIKLVFSSRYEWMYNRPDPDQWIKFVDSLPESAIPTAEKDAFVKYFEESKKSYEKFGVML